MAFSVRTTAVLAGAAVAGVVLTGCNDDLISQTPEPGPSATGAAVQQSANGTPAAITKIDVDGKSVNVSCMGNAEEGQPVVVLLAGLGDSAKDLAGIQETLSENNRVCSYDRLGQGKSDQPDGPQDFASSGKVLTAVLDDVAGDSPVVLAGHSLGGVIAARYAPDHQDRVRGLVLMDATSPTAIGDATRVIPESATGQAAQVRAEIVAVGEGKYSEQLAVLDGEVRSAGDIPVEVIQHGQPYLGALPEYGPELERMWAEGQRKWLALSSRAKLSTATKSSHHIYVDQPDVAVQAIERVTAQVAS